MAAAHPYRGLKIRQRAAAVTPGNGATAMARQKFCIAGIKSAAASFVPM